MIRFGVVLSVVLVAIGLLVTGVVAGSLLLVVISTGVAALAFLLLLIVVVVSRHEIFGQPAAAATRPLAIEAANAKQVAGWLAAERAAEAGQAADARRAAVEPVAAEPALAGKSAVRDAAVGGPKATDGKVSDGKVRDAVVEPAKVEPAKVQHAKLQHGKVQHAKGQNAKGHEAAGHQAAVPAGVKPNDRGSAKPGGAKERATPGTAAVAGTASAEPGKPAEQTAPAVRLIDAAAARAKAAEGVTPGRQETSGRPNGAPDQLRPARPESILDRLAATNQPSPERAASDRDAASAYRASRLERESARAAGTRTGDSGAGGPAVGKPASPDEPAAPDRPATADKPATADRSAADKPAVWSRQPEPRSDRPAAVAATSGTGGSGARPAGAGQEARAAAAAEAQARAAKPAAPAPEPAVPAPSPAAAEAQAGGPDLPAPAEPASAGEPADDVGAMQVSVVPGITRYHRSDCLLIRFLAPDDLEVMSRQAAADGGCVPCKACKPDQVAANHPVG